MVLLKLVALLCFVGFCLNVSISATQDPPTLSLSSVYEFEHFVQRYQKHYENDAVFSMRYRIFHDNLQKIHELNSRPGMTWTAGINEFTDLTWSEFQRKKLGATAQDCSATAAFGKSYVADANFADIPESKGWRNENVLTAVKNQGNCGR